MPPLKSYRLVYMYIHVRVHTLFIRCPCIFLWLRGKYGVTYDETYGVIYDVVYEVIQANFRDSLARLWAMKIARCVQQLMREYIITCLSLCPTRELFEHMQSLRLRNAIDVCS